MKDEKNTADSRRKRCAHCSGELGDQAFCQTVKGSEKLFCCSSCYDTFTADSRRKFVDHPEIYRHTPDCPLYWHETVECTCADSRQPIPEGFLTTDEFVAQCKAVGIVPTDEDREWARSVIATAEKGQATD